MVPHFYKKLKEKNHNGKNKIKIKLMSPSLNNY
jgi:hypothetical protein